MSGHSPNSRICDDGYKMDIVTHEGHHWFRAADVARHLGYANGREAVIRHVKQKDRTTKEFLVPGGDHAVYVNESGLRALIRRSRKPEAKDFEAWVALKMDELRGSTTRRPKNRMQIQLLNEKDLHYKVVDYLRRFYPEAILVPGLGELQDSEAKRLDAWAKGYVGGTCDLMILHPNDSYSGFGIEFKTPLGTGILRESQQKFLDRLQEAGHTTLVSNDYDEICRAIMGYFS
jgi:prophage antirepressor-like protein